MRPLTKKAAALFGGAVLVVLAWPGPSSAETTLGGYSASAWAEPVRIKVYEPALPLPSEPQVDGGIAFTRSSTETGPVSRALASYLWPGDVVGDGFDALTGHPGDAYPIQVNSRYPATNTAPAKNTAQLTEGNGMTTSSDDVTTQATVDGFGISGTNPLSDPLKGLCKLLSPKDPSKCSKADIPVPLPSTAPLLGIVQMENVYSQSTVKVSGDTITSTATTHMSKIKLFGGLVTIGGIDLTSKTVSNGTKATTTGTSKIGALSIAGTEIAIDGKTITLKGQVLKLPPLPLDLSKLGISIAYAQNQRTVDGATGAFSAQGLILSVDTATIFKLLALDKVQGALQDLLNKIPDLGQNLGPFFGLHPKIVVELGSVSTTATAAPAYVPGDTTTPPPGGTTTPPPGTDYQPPTGPIDNSPLPDDGGLPTDTPPPTNTNNPPPAGPAAFDLPGLGKVPKMLILGGLVLAGAIGWLFRMAGGFLLGGGRNCSFGLDTGVPDLRKV